MCEVRHAIAVARTRFPCSTYSAVISFRAVVSPVPANPLNDSQRRTVGRRPSGAVLLGRQPGHRAGAIQPGLRYVGPAAIPQGSAEPEQVTLDRHELGRVVQGMTVAILPQETEQIADRETVNLGRDGVDIRDGIDQVARDGSH
ncbi:MAG: hypothetical protein K2Y56_19600 [Methylobacterium sp.]|jgi:hypothetical protein|uniref:hypothetical protein n=1 Tax=Methylobacterium sp. TaxID=409 RepID=UPI0025F73377|nr:hypothetical protein [Methylobacterium sp.]MBX9933693.1 hypothetical protein [Methylobacterium sp.]